MNKVRQDSATNATVTSIQEKAAVDRLTQAYNDAKIEADEYIDTIARRNQRELAGIGQGTKAREIQAGLDEIEDKRIAARARIARDRRNNPDIDPQVYDRYLAVAEETYRREVDLYNQRTEAITAAESNWVNGAKQALSNYADEARNVAKQTEELFTNAFRSLEDALTSSARPGKLNFKSWRARSPRTFPAWQSSSSITGPLAECSEGHYLAGRGERGGGRRRRDCCRCCGYCGGGGGKGGRGHGVYDGGHCRRHDVYNGGHGGGHGTDDRSERGRNRTDGRDYRGGDGVRDGGHSGRHDLCLYSHGSSGNVSGYQRGGWRRGRRIR